MNATVLQGKLSGYRSCRFLSKHYSIAGFEGKADRRTARSKGKEVRTPVE